MDRSSSRVISKPVSRAQSKSAFHIGRIRSVTEDRNTESGRNGPCEWDSHPDGLPLSFHRSRIKGVCGNRTASRKGELGGFEHAKEPHGPIAKGMAEENTGIDPSRGGRRLPGLVWSKEALGYIPSKNAVSFHGSHGSGESSSTPIRAFSRRAIVLHAT
ncbi:hypothetical protein CRG98_042330 [Punica granatum]|uniref:Uncharacterized protein n=1 Tax=Punica granatum TaxID=22663 RepID=A0A2I0HZZ6_PUNGR|nr:hypothetical protein CRG98_042330 [Punica granatum]